MYIIAIAATVVLILIDQITKYLATAHLKPIGRFPLIDGVFELFYTTNDGAAFSILRGFRWGFVILAALILALIVYYFLKLPRTKVYNKIRICLVLICGGAIGNTIDRAFHGEVVDFFYFSLIDFAVFNMADVFVVCGCIGLSALLLFSQKGNVVKKDVENS